MSEQINILKRSLKGGIIFETSMDTTDEPFCVKGQGLYIWQTKSKYTLGIPHYKFGQYGTDAEGGKLPQETIESYSGIITEPIVILWCIKLTKEQIEKIGDAKHIEQIVNKKIGPKVTEGNSTEQFETTLDIIKDEVTKVLYPNASISFIPKAIYPPRQRQSEAISQFLDYIRLYPNKPYYDFLLGAVMRFGKNFTFLQMAKRTIPINGNILMITNRPDTFATLDNDVYGHMDFDNFCHEQLKDKKFTWSPKPNRINVLSVSTQLLTNKKNSKELIKFLSQFVWHIKGIDEADTGMLTELSDSLLKKLPTKYTIWISGTPWKVLSTGKFKPANTFSYDYINQQEDKKAGIDTRAVSLDWYCMNTHPIISEQQKWYSDSEGFTLTKFWGFNEDTQMFIHEGDVVNFIKSIFGKIPKNTSFSPYSIIPKLKHTIWMLPPSTNAVLRLKELIESIVGDEYKVFAATGNDTDDITDVQDFLKWNKDKKTIVLTITRFTRGTTVPEWDGAFVLNDTDKAELYFQFCFRPTSPMTGKDKGYVFDFNPNRTINMLADYARYSAKQRGITSQKQILSKFLDNFNVYAVDGGVEWKKRSLEDVLRIVRESDYNSKTLRTSVRDYVSVDNITTSILDLLMSLDSDKKGKLKLEITKSQHSPKGKNKKILNKLNKVTFDKVKSDLYAKIGTLVSKLPIICELDGYNSVEDILNKLPDELFYGATKTDKQILKILVENKIIDVYTINSQLELE
jgi:hypothetical protein